MKKNNKTKSIQKKEDSSRWLALGVLCMGTLMEVLDSTIVNVALPSIKTELNFSDASLAWVINAYMLTFGGLLLLGGRLGDLFGQRKLFLIGIAIFTVASLACGMSQDQTFLIAARAIQGIGGAISSAVSLSLVMNLFPESDARAKAMGIFGFVAAGGGSVGVLLGGLLTALNWHLIFLVNIPVGIIVLALGFKILPNSKILAASRHLDIGGAITVTLSLMLAVYAIVNGNQNGWLSVQTLGLLGIAIILLGLFVWLESKVKAPLIPLSLFKIKSVTVSNIIATLWAASMFAWFFLSALYLQLIVHYKPLEVGFAFLPANIIMAIFSIWLSAKFVMRFGLRIPLSVGLFLAAVGLALLGRAPVVGNYFTDVLPSMILLGVGGGMAFNPMLLAAMNDVKADESGLASGLVNTSFMMGGALGLAILASLAASVTMGSLAAGRDNLNALNDGYHAAFLVGGSFALLAAILGGTLLRISKNRVENKQFE